MNIRTTFEITKLNINLVVTICTTTFNIETFCSHRVLTVNSQLSDITGGIGRGLEKSVRQQCVFIRCLANNLANM